jgi:uncharacterized C2H2 Zn-finger protein
MKNESSWFTKYIITLLKIHLKQTKSDFDTKPLLPPSLSFLDNYFRERVSGIAKEKQNGFECMFCGRVFATRKSIYLHLIKKHKEDIESYAQSLIKEIEDKVRRTGELLPLSDS